MEYNKAVDELQAIARNNWRIGEIADSVEPKYGEETLQRLAKDSGHDYETMKRCRSVWVAYGEIGLRSPNSFGVCKAFATQDDRAELTNKKWTVKAAHELVQKRAEEARKKEETRNLNKKTFNEYYEQLVKWLGMLKDFQWPQEHRDRMADLLELAVKELRS